MASAQPAVLVVVDDDLPAGGLELALGQQAWLAMGLVHTLVRLSDLPTSSALPATTTAVVLYGMELSDHNIPALVLRQYMGPVYGASVGINPSADPGALQIFDHLFVRTEVDRQAALGLGVDPCNLTVAADLGYSVLSPSTAARASIWRPRSVSRAFLKGRPAIAFCVRAASPALDFEATMQLLEQLQKGFEVVLVSCDPDDLMWSQQLSSSSNRRLHVLDQAELHDPVALARIFPLFAGVVTMHYAAAMMALRAGLPCIGHQCSHAMTKMPGLVTFDGAATQPQGVAEQIALHLLDCRYGRAPLPPPIAQPMEARHRLRMAISLLQRKQIRAPGPQVVAAAAAALPQLSSMLASYLAGLSCEEAGSWLSTAAPASSKRLFIESRRGATDEVARMFNFAATRQVGLCADLKHQIFGTDAQPPAQALEWLVTKHREPTPGNDEYCPNVRLPSAPRFVDMSFIDQHDCSGLHRCGWAWVLKGLQRLDGNANGRQASLRLDAYLDRSMLWGYETLKAAGVLPYTVPWAGFIHHTLSSGVATMFAKPLFLQSLPSCRCLLVLTDYLARQVREALSETGHGGIPVHVIRHPMQELPSSKHFSLRQFLGNPARKVVQVGAWLRNTWAIFQLTLPTRPGSQLELQKAALVGRNMEGYYQPPDTIDRIRKWLLDTPASTPPPANDDGMCRLPGQLLTNQCTAGMLDMLQDMHDSVDMLPRLSDEGYDDLLASEGIVFLDLIDASAVNTVLECLLRGTPLIVRRHPALEEVLGPTYPGFYGDLTEAAALATSIPALATCNAYLKALPKDSLRLDTFLEQVQEAVKRSC